MSKIVVNEDWLSRVNIPDVYPRRDDPFKPSAGVVPPGAPPASLVGTGELVAANVWDGWLTQPGTRPVVYQRALNFNITANTTPIPLLNGAMQCETIVLDVENGVANSIFFGFGSGVTTTSGIEVRPGLPIEMTTENTREQWEMQRVLEAIAGMIGSQIGAQGMGSYRAPRVVFDASDFFVVATAATVVRVMIFPTPEYQ